MANVRQQRLICRRKITFLQFFHHLRGKFDTNVKSHGHISRPTQKIVENVQEIGANHPNGLQSVYSTAQAQPNTSSATVWQVHTTSNMK